MEFLAKCPAADFIEIESPMRNAFIRQHKPIKQIGKQICKLNKFNFPPLTLFSLGHSWGGKNNTALGKWPRAIGKTVKNSSSKIENPTKIKPEPTLN